jgi:hypothetical protein
MIVPRLIVRPRFRLAVPRRQILVLGSLVVSVWLTSEQSLGHLIRAALVGAACGSGFVVYGWALSRRSYLRVHDGALAYRGLVRERILAGPGEAVAIVHVNCGGAPWQIWSGPQGTKVVDERAWPRGQLAELARITRAAVSEGPDERDVTSFARRYPTAMPGWARHPIPVTLAVFVALALIFLVLGGYS